MMAGAWAVTVLGGAASTTRTTARTLESQKSAGLEVGTLTGHANVGAIPAATEPLLRRRHQRRL